MLKHFDDPQVFSVAASKQDETGSHGKGIIIFFRGFYLHFRSQEDYQKWLLTMRTTRHSGAREPSDRIPKKDAIAVLQHDQKVECSAWGDGGSQAIRKSYYEKIGGFDPHYYLYWEDVDLGFRAWKAGYKIIYEPRAVLLHAKHEGPIAKKFTASEIRNLNLRNQIYFTRKNSNLWHKLQFLFWLPYHLIIAVKNRDRVWIKEVFGII